MADYARTSEPFRPRKRRRVLWIILGLLVAFVIGPGILLRHGHITVAQGYLPANQEYGYGYDLWRLHEENTLGWRTDRPVRLVLWKARKRPVFGQYFEIDGQQVKTSGVAGGWTFALQPDYTCKGILLSEGEAKRLVALVDEGIQGSRIRNQGAFWRDRIEPQLRFVGDVPTTNLSDLPAGTE